MPNSTGIHLQRSVFEEIVTVTSVAPAVASHFLFHHFKRYILKFLNT